MNTPTPHNAAVFGQIAETVLMPGDPLRAKVLAETYLENPVQFNSVRGMYGYTGTYRGVPVSVQGTGMGMPSIGIYSWELFHFYDVKNIIRIGSAGAMSGKLKLRDVVAAQGACTNSNYQAQYNLNGSFSPIASYDLLRRAVSECEAIGVRYKVGNLLSSDVFYHADPNFNNGWYNMGVLGVEMEAAALYMNAAAAGKNALVICTVSDHILRGEALDADARQNTFTDMMSVALNVAASM